MATTVNTSVNTGKLENQLIQGLLSTPSLRDWQHASKIFTPGSFALVPKFSFNFYVYFDYDPQPFGLQTPTASAQLIGALCKSAQLPKFTFEHKTLNAYNRVDKIQTKVKYEPVTLKFHDDSSDVIRNFWYDYYSFFYRDADYSPEIYQMKTKYHERQKDKWGYTPRPEANGYINGFGGVNVQNGGLGETNYNPLRAIRIYSMSRKNFSEYVLLNPMITSFQHGEHQMEGSGLMEHQMTIEYQAVKYYKGKVSEQEFSSSFLLLYDQTKSPLQQAGFGSSIFGAGGVADGFNTIGNDLASGNGAAALLNSARIIQQIQQNGGIQNMLQVEAQSAIPQLIEGNLPSQSPWAAPAPADNVASSAASQDAGIATTPASAAAANETAVAAQAAQPPAPVEQAPPVVTADAQAKVTSGSDSVLSKTQASVVAAITTVQAPEVVPAVSAQPTVADLEKQSAAISQQIAANSRNAFDPALSAEQRAANLATYQQLQAQQKIVNDQLYRAEQAAAPVNTTATATAVGVRTAVVMATIPPSTLNDSLSSTNSQQGVPNNK
jgi:hypothetical protein